MILLLDIGNTHTHLGLANSRRVVKQTDIPTATWSDQRVRRELSRFVGSSKVSGACYCCVVPAVAARVNRLIHGQWKVNALALTPRTVKGIGIRYPKPDSIGQDRLANAVAVRHHFGAPAVVVDFGTAVTFDVVDRAGNYVGGIIAPGLAAMTDYLHERTALLPRIRIREINSVIGKSTEEAMQVGAIHGYRGLVRELLTELRQELKCRRLAVVATGGYAKLMASKLPFITAVEPLLTLEGLRLVWLANGTAGRVSRPGGPRKTLAN